MSVTAIAWAWKQKVARNLLPELLALADNANDLGICWVKVATIATKTKTTERTVQRNLTTLSSEGLVDIIERRMKGSGNRCNLYLLPIPGIDPQSQRDFIAEMTTGTKAIKRARREGDTSVTQGATPASPRGDTHVTHNHKNEPSLKGLSNPTRAEADDEPTKPTKPKGKHRLPTDWTVPADLKEKLLAEGYQEAQINEQEDKFRIYWQERNDKQAQKASWKLAFLNWMKRAGKEKAGPEGPASSQFKPNRGHYDRNQQRQSTGAGLLGQLADKSYQESGGYAPPYIDAEYERH